MNILHLQLSGGPGGIVSLCRDINKHSAHHNFFTFFLKAVLLPMKLPPRGAQCKWPPAPRTTR